MNSYILEKGLQLAPLRPESHMQASCSMIAMETLCVECGVCGSMRRVKKESMFRNTTTKSVSFIKHVGVDTAVDRTT